MLTAAALCLAANIYHEARSEPIIGQYAVALVTMNRAGGDPDRVCNVVLARKQFSWTARLVKGRKVLRGGLPREKDAWALAQAVASVTLSGGMVDITKGSTFYHEARIRPSWAGAYVKVRQVGHHVFYRHNQYVISDLSQRGKKV